MTPMQRQRLACRSARRALMIFVLVWAGALSAHADTVDAIVRKQMEKQHIPGLVLAVVKDGKPVKVHGYGLANLELATPATPKSVFRIGSLSKQFLAAAIMLLANDGRLALDDKAARYLDDAPPAWQDITIRHLLTHTSGLIREAPAFALLKVQSDAEVIKSAYAAPLLFTPGEKWQYSNLGYFILAEIITRVSGQPWPQFVDTRVFKPLSMTSSAVTSVTPIIPYRADGYVYRNRQYEHASTLLALRPSGAFMSTMSDLLKWDAALNAGALLPQTTLNAMWTATPLNDGTSWPYGFGWEVTEIGTHRAIQHGGTIPGFRSYYLRLPDDRLSVIVLTNNEASATEAIAPLIALQYIDDLVPDRRVTKVSLANLEALSGSYWMAAGEVATFTRTARGLHFSWPAGRTDTLLLPHSPTRFFSDDDPRLQVAFDTSGAGLRVRILVNGVVQASGTRD
jgi:D-alanyl-D-alanine carboxypeptidase